MPVFVCGLNFRISGGLKDAKYMPLFFSLLSTSAVEVVSDLNYYEERLQI